MSAEYSEKMVESWEFPLHHGAWRCDREYPGVLIWTREGTSIAIAATPGWETSDWDEIPCEAQTDDGGLHELPTVYMLDGVTAAEYIPAVARFLDAVDAGEIAVDASGAITVSDKAMRPASDDWSRRVGKK